jgi:hypothetical protein
MASFTASFKQPSADKTPTGDKPAVSVDNQYEDAEKNYQPKSLKFWTIMIGMYLSIFLVGLDRTIIATAIPKITDEFKLVLLFLSFLRLLWKPRAIRHVSRAGLRVSEYATLKECPIALGRPVSPEKSH